MSDERPGVRELVTGFLPGTASAGTLVLALGAGVVGLALVLMAGGLALDMKGRVALGAAGLVCWGHGAVWLTTGEVQRLDSGLADLSGAAWGVFFALWWGPLTLAYWLAGALLRSG